MNTEADFHAHLDAHPYDHTARLVFADWLQERDDPRADGYRALGTFRRVPLHFEATESGTEQWCWCEGTAFSAQQHLTPAWLQQIPNVGPPEAPCKHYRPQNPAHPWTRREAEDAAALAWGRMTRKAQRAYRELFAFWCEEQARYQALASTRGAT